MHFDLIVIGSGPGGQKAALQAAKAGKKVMLIEEYPAVGGGCVHFGTLPSKSFRESVYRWAMSSSGTLGEALETKRSTTFKRARQQLPEMQRLLKRKDRVISQESQIIFDQLKRNKVHLMHGHARFKSPTEVEVQTRKGKKKFSATYFVIAVGASPRAPDPLKIDGKRILDSNTVLRLKKMPQSLIVLGAGIIGCEFASMFAIAGCRVTLIDKRKEILSNIDREIVGSLLNWFGHTGMQTNLGCESEKVEVLKDRVRVRTSSGKVCEAEALLVAQGRQGNTQDLGLENAGLSADERGLLSVDAHFRTSVQHIYAVGDVVGFPALASTSMEQGRIAACHAFGVRGALVTRMPEFYPYGIYTIPEISTIGESEEELKKRGVDYVVGRAKYKEVARGQIVGDRWGLLKMLVDRKTLKLLGVHIIGDSAADLIHIGQAVMILGGDLNYFVGSVFNYPTLAEAYKTAALDSANKL